MKKIIILFCFLYSAGGPDEVNGMTPSMMNKMNNMMNPMNSLTLYKVENEGSERKIILQKNSWCAFFIYFIILMSYFFS